MRYKGKFPYLVVVVLACVITACSRQEDKQSVKAERLNVVSTVAPITSIVENIGGDKIGLTGIIPEGINSHTFEPVPSDVKLLAQADLLIANGLDLEIPTMSLARANMKKGAGLLPLGEKTISEKEYIYDFSFPKEHGHPNPHLWLDPQHAAHYATLIRDELIRLDPNNKSAYEANGAAFLKKLGALDRAIEESVKTIPESNRRLLTYHDSWPYFARRVFGSEVFPSPVLEQIAREGKTRYIDKLRDDELPGNPRDARHSYIGMMLENLSIMFEALGGSAQALNNIDPSPVAGSHANYRRKD
jgi:ABC-type Zn uptake system ZnuABC Zn-binding protein ZnuA